MDGACCCCLETEHNKIFGGTTRCNLKQTATIRTTKGTTTSRQSGRQQTAGNRQI